MKKTSFYLKFIKDLVSHKLYLSAVGRILVGAYFLIIGVSKLIDLTSVTDYLHDYGIAYPTVVAITAGLITTIAGAALLANYRAKVSAIILVFYTMAATLILHHPGLWLTDPTAQIMFLKNFAILGGLLFMSPYLRSK